MIDRAAIADRIAHIRERIDETARAAGRDGSRVRIVAVTKKLSAEAVVAAFEAGLGDVGENYVQEAVGKIAEVSRLAPAGGLRWHLIGRLQSNKAAVAVRAFSLLHGIDSASTVAALSRAASRDGRTMDVLLQIRLGARTGSGAARSGIEADMAADFLGAAAAHANVRFTGLMGVADPDLPARPQFASLRELAARLSVRAPANAPLGDLSMGMTGDFEDAVAEGATLVRIGTAIFGERPG